MSFKFQFHIKTAQHRSAWEIIHTFTSTPTSLSLSLSLSWLSDSADELFNMFSSFPIGTSTSFSLHSSYSVLGVLAADDGLRWNSTPLDLVDAYRVELFPNASSSREIKTIWMNGKQPGKSGKELMEAGSSDDLITVLEFTKAHSGWIKVTALVLIR